MAQGICGFPSRLSHEAFPRGFPKGVSHVRPWCESILSLNVEAVLFQAVLFQGACCGGRGTGLGGCGSGCFAGMRPFILTSSCGNGSRGALWPCCLQWLPLHRGLVASAFCQALRGLGVALVALAFALAWALALPLALLLPLPWSWAWPCPALELELDLDLTLTLTNNGRPRDLLRAPEVQKQGPVSPLPFVIIAKTFLADSGSAPEEASSGSVFDTTVCLPGLSSTRGLSSRSRPHVPLGRVSCLFSPHCQRVEPSSLCQRYKNSN